MSSSVQKKNKNKICIQCSIHTFFEHAWFSDIQSPPMVGGSDSPKKNWYLVPFGKHLHILKYLQTIPFIFYRKHALKKCWNFFGHIFWVFILFEWYQNTSWCGTKIHYFLRYYLFQEFYGMICWEVGETKMMESIVFRYLTQCKKSKYYINYLLKRNVRKFSKT